MGILVDDGSGRATKAGLAKWKKLRDAVKKVWDSEEYKTRRSKMDRHLRQFEGKIWKDSPNAPKGHESKAIANYLFSTIESSAPMMSDNRPAWTVVAKVPWLQNLANAYKMAGDYAWDVLEMSMTSYYGSVDAFLFGTGIFKIYWDFEEDELAIDNVDPRTFILAPGYTKIKKAPWCGTYESLPLSWVRRRWPGIKGIKPAKDDEKFNYSGSETWELDNYFTNVYTLWMKDDETADELVEEVLGEDAETKKKRKKKALKYPNGKFVYFTDTTFLACEASEFEHGQAPYVEQKDYDVPHKFWAMGEADQIEGLNLELNLMLRKIFTHIRNYADPNQLVDANMFAADPSEIQDHYKDGGQVYLVNTGSKKLEDFVGFAPQPPVMQDVWQIISLIIKLIEEITGVTDISKGIPGKKERQSASEISVLIESSYTRVRQKTRNQESALQRMFWLIINLMQQYYAGQRPIHNKQENGDYAHMNIGNSVAYARQQVASPDLVAQAKQGQQLTPQQQELYENYKQFAAAIEGADETDPVYFPFDVEVETNSQLPLDKQSLANLMLRLFQMKGVDRRSVLEILQIPRGQEIADRMDAQEQQAQGPSPGGGPMPPQAASRPQPGPNMSLIQGGQNE